MIYETSIIIQGMKYSIGSLVSPSEALSLPINLLFSMLTLHSQEVNIERLKEMGAQTVERCLIWR